MTIHKVQKEQTIYKKKNYQHLYTMGHQIGDYGNHYCSAYFTSIDRLPEEALLRHANTEDLKCKELNLPSRT